jgi:hypothetical protein
MTLIVSEVNHDPRDKQNCRILCAADRRVSVDGIPTAARRKLFKHDRLNATISYFGLAETSAKMSFEYLLGDFIGSDSSSTIEVMASTLAKRLDSIVPKRLLRKYPSGFHVCGFTDRGIPQFWFIRNIRGLNGLYYADFEDSYTVSEELSQVHARQFYREASKDYSVPFRAWFANGDLRSHGPAWEKFDAFSNEMDLRGLANQPLSASDFEKRLRWKMEAIGLYYDIVADEVIVGGGTDTYILTI